MKIWKLAGTAALGMAALGSVSGGISAQSPTEVRWLSDFEQASAESRRSGKPLFVAFR